MQQMTLTLLSEEDIVRIIREAVTQILAELEPAFFNDPLRLLSRKEVAEKLHITLSTLNSWTRTGKIQGRRIGRRVLYCSHDVERALKAIKNPLNTTL